MDVDEARLLLIDGGIHTAVDKADRRKYSALCVGYRHNKKHRKI